MIDQHPSSSVVAEPASRRRLLRLIGAGGAALMATLLPRDGVRALHDGTTVFHLGEGNFADDSTQLDADFAPATGTTPAFGVFGHGQVPLGIIGTVDGGRGIEGGSGGGLPGEPESHGVGVSGLAGHDGIGVRGESLSAEGVFEDQDGAGPGVLGLSGSGFGVEGRSNSGPGVAGFSVTGPGGTFGSEGDGSGVEATGSGEGPGVHGRSEGNGPGGSFESNSGPGVWGNSEIGPGILGRSLLDVGVFGFSASDDDSSTGDGVGGFSKNHIGGRFASENGIGLRAVSPGEQPAVQAASGTLKDGEPHFDFEPDDPNPGLALEVIGRARFSTSGKGTVPAGAESAEISDAAVTPDSHVMVTLTSDPGGRQVRWVEKGTGTFTVHMTSTPPPQRQETDFSYLIVEMPAS